MRAPGPGAYDPKFDQAKENIGGAKIGSSTRNALKAAGGKDIPGPG